MPKYTTLTALFSAIANSIRGKTGGTDPIVADDFPEVIDGITTKTPTQEKTISITSNGTVEVTPDEGYVMSKVTANVNVPKDGVDKIQRYLELNKARGLSYMFYNYLGETVDELMDGVDTSSVDNASNAFYYCTGLTSVPLFDTSNVRNMENMFNGCNKLLSVPLFNTSKVVKMNGMFNSCTALTSVPLFDTSNVTNMESMFNGCRALTTVPLFNTSKVTNMRLMVAYNEVIKEVPLFDTSNVTNMESMFNGCKELTIVPLFNTSKVTNMRNLFYGCTKLTSVPLYDTSNVTNMYYFAFNCGSLTSVPALDMRNVTDATSPFYYCTALTEIWIRNIKTNLQVGSGTSYGHLLTLESLLHLCKECRDTGSQKTLTIGTANLNKLANVYVKLIDITDEMRAEDDLIDEKSPFVQCESTDEGAMLIADYMTIKNWVLK